LATPFDIRAAWMATATARQGNVFWFRKGDPVANDPQGDVGAWLDLDPATNNVGLLADSSTGEKINGLNDWMYFDKARLWFPLIGTSGWSATYDCEFRWRHHAIAGKTTGDPKRVSMTFEVGRAVFQGVEVVYRHAYDASVDDSDVEYSYYDRNMREIRWEMWHKGSMVQHTQPVPFTGPEAFVVAPRPQPYGPIGGQVVAKPTITIRDYWPREGTAPLRWQATAVTTGKISSIVWRYRKQGAKSWTLKPDDSHTTVTFTSPGTYEIGVDCFGPGGSDGTATPRLIVVTA